MPEQLQFCRMCGGSYPERELSHRGICGRCGKMLYLDAMKQMRAKFGPVYEKWRTRYIAAMSGVLVRLEKEREQND